MKKIFCYLLIAALVLGVFAGCKKQDPSPTESTGASQTENTEAKQTQNTETKQTENTETTQTETTEVTEPENAEKTKAFQVVIVHKDGTTKELSLETEEKYFGAALINAGVVEAEENLFGMHINKADGEKAVFEEDIAEHRQGHPCFPER